MSVICYLNNLCWLIGPKSDPDFAALLSKYSSENIIPAQGLLKSKLIRQLCTIAPMGTHYVRH
jgi:hypothetical protein